MRLGENNEGRPILEGNFYPQQPRVPAFERPMQLIEQDAGHTRQGDATEIEQRRNGQPDRAS